MFYITKQKGLYQNKVNFSLVSTCNCNMSYCKLGWLQLKEIVHLKCLRCCNGKSKTKKKNLGSNHKHLQASKVSFLGFNVS